MNSIDYAPEKAVLGAVLLDPRSIFALRPLLTPEDFSDHQLAQLYQLLLDMHEAGHPIDLATVVGRTMKEPGKYPAADELAALTDAASSSAMAEAYARTVAQLAATRRLDGTLARMRKELQRYDDPSAFVRDLSSALHNATHQRSLDTTASLATALHAYEEQFHTSWKEKRGHGTRLGIDAGLDKLLFNGLHPETLCVIGARPSHGKTAMGLSIAHQWASQGRGVFIGSTESPVNALTGRLNQIAVPEAQYADAYHNPQARRQLLSLAWGDMRRLPIWMHFSREGKTIENMTWIVQNHIHQHPETELVIFDFLQNFRTSVKGLHQDKVAQINIILERIKDLQHAIKRPIILFSQLNRTDFDDEKGPMEWHFKGSGGIEQDADILIALYVRKQDQHLVAREVPLMAKVLKQRDGPTGIAWLRFVKPQTKVTGEQPVAAPSQSSLATFQGKSPWAEKEEEELF